MATISSGERRARFEALFAATHRQVRAYALRRAAPEVAQDAVAETFVVAWRRLDEVPDPALPWLLGVARRTLANARRSQARADALAVRAADEWGAGVAPDPADAVTGAAAIRHALAELSDRDREVLLLIAWDALAPDAAARVLGCSKATFAVRLHRARQRFAAALALAERAAVNDPSPQEAR
jgi:RNA polymerase sigma-70 factor (ECF subfamily)